VAQRMLEEGSAVEARHKAAVEQSGALAMAAVVAPRAGKPASAHQKLSGTQQVCWVCAKPGHLSMDCKLRTVAYCPVCTGHGHLSAAHHFWEGSRGAASRLKVGKGKRERSLQVRTNHV
jgi:hypothetical protein